MPVRTSLEAVVDPCHMDPIRRELKVHLLQRECLRGVGGKGRPPDQSVRSYCRGCLPQAAQRRFAGLASTLNKHLSLVPSCRAAQVFNLITEMTQHDGGQPVDRWFEADYWRALNPSCSVSECEPPEPIELSPAQIEQLRDRMDLDGYFDLSETMLRECAGYMPLIRRLRGAVTTLVSVLLPPML